MNGPVGIYRGEKKKIQAKYFHRCIFNFAGSGPTVLLCNNTLRDLGSRGQSTKYLVYQFYLGKYRTVPGYNIFVCATLFRVIKKNGLYLP